MSVIIDNLAPGAVKNRIMGMRKFWEPNKNKVCFKCGGKMIDEYCLKCQLVAVCCVCKAVRLHNGNWVDKPIHAHHFLTHTYCPTCANVVKKGIVALKEVPYGKN